MDDFGASMMEIFVLETNGFLERIENLMMGVESGDSGMEQAVPELFRIMHTIKSSSAMMSLGSVSAIAHKLEDIFAFIRERGDNGTDPETMFPAVLTDIVLNCVDFMRRNIEGAAEPPDEPMTRLEGFLSGLKAADGAENTLPSMPSDSVPPEKVTTHRHRIVVFLKKDTQMPGVHASEVRNRVAEQAISVRMEPEDAEQADGDRLKKHGFVLDITSALTPDETGALIEELPFVERWKPDSRKPAVGTDTHEAERRGAGAYVSVAVSKLNHLADMAGEAVVAEIDARRAGGQNQSVRAQNALKKHIMDIQETALSMRMVPLADIFHKLGRLARDISRKQNKEVEFSADGADTEIDRDLLEDISPPLIHLLRNAVDHGIEPPDERISAGKPAGGTVSVSARAEGRFVVITMSDDGRGINRNAVVGKAVSRGMIKSEQAEYMTPEDINDLIFTPGFSTKESVDEISGRGVGMDVVSENIKKLSGHVSVNSTPGGGTSVTLKIPLTLAIIDAIIIKIDDRRYALPLFAVAEIFGVGVGDASGSVARAADAGDSAPGSGRYAGLRFGPSSAPRGEHVTQAAGIGGIRRINGEYTCLLCGEVLRIVGLHSDAPPTSGVLIRLRGEPDGMLFAEGISERQSILVKPPPLLLEGIQAVSGCTVLADGRVSLILDAGELLKQGGIQL